MLPLGMRTSPIFNSRLATRCNRVAKRVQHIAPNNVAICCVQMLRWFGRSMQMMGYVALRCCYRLAGATDRKFVWRNMLHAFGHPVTTCCELRVENRTSAHAQAQQFCTNLAKRLQHHVTCNNTQHACRNTSQHGGQTHATCCAQQCCDMLG